MSEFDYNPSDMDQLAPIKPIPTVSCTSLANSRARISSSRRVLMDLEYYIEQAKNKENIRMENMRERQRNISDDVAKQQIQRNIKVKELQKEMKDKEMKECTFKPKTNSNPQKQKNRNFHQFLESQNAHTKKILEKREMLKKNIEERNAKALQKQQVPRKNKSKRSQKDGIAVHQRLYALKDKEFPQSYDQPNNTFKPEINERSKNIIRVAPVQELLYNQALRRQENDAMIESNKHNIKYQKPVNQANQRYAAQKFIKEFFFILEQLDLNPSTNSIVDYMMFNQILKNLGFVCSDDDSQSQLSSNQRTLIHDAYQILQGFRPNARNICVFLLGIIGIYHINPVNFEEGEEPDSEHDFNLDEIQGRKLQRHFDLFFRNRLTSDVPRRFQEQISTFSFQPKINPLSEQMAEKHRAAMLEKANELIRQYPELADMIPEDGVVTHTDLLVLHKVATEIEKGAKKVERESQQLRDCTFKPNTIASSISASQMTDSKTGFKKSVELYQYHKEMQNRKESLRFSRQQQLDPECTFQPQTNAGKISKQPNSPISRQVDQTLFRMHKGREQNEKKKKFLERGEKQVAYKQKPRQPILLLGVNLGQTSDKISLFEGDENRLKEISRQFGKKHGLDKQSEQRLIEMLEGQLKSVLTKVQEEENWSQEDDE